MESKDFSANAEVDIRNFLKNEFLKKRKKNPRFSLRAYAKKIKISHSVLSEIFNGKRQLTQKTLSRLMKFVSVDESTSAQFAKYVKKKQKIFTQSEDRAVKFMGEWYYSAVLEYLLINQASHDENQIAQSLDCPISEIRQALKNLLELKYLKKNKKNRYEVQLENTTTWGNLNAVEYSNRIMKQFLEMERIVIDKIPIEQRSMVGYTLAMDPDDLGEARKIIYDFLKTLAGYLERKSAVKKQVYRLNLGLFPISKLHVKNV